MMHAIQWRRIVILIVIAVSVQLSNCTREKCKMDIVNFEKPEYVKDDNGTTKFYAFHSRLTFVYTFTSQCIPVVRFLFVNNNTIDDVNSRYYRIEKRLMNFITRFSHSPNTDKYQAKLIIDQLTNKYDGVYKLVIQDSSDLQTKLEHSFDVNYYQGNVEHEFPPCFLPLVENIIATPHGLITGDINAINIRWEVSKKEDSNLQYCSGSKKWRVTLFEFSSIENVPRDHETQVVIPSSKWNIVPGFNTSYTFSKTFLTNKYYIFQISHRPEDLPREVESKVFASNAYYFGQQIPATIEKFPGPGSIRTLKVGLSDSIRCVANGFPTPNVIWIKADSDSFIPLSGNGSSVLELHNVTAKDAGIYYCIASNILVNPPVGRRTESDTWTVEIIVEDYSISETGVSCNTEVLDASICKNYIYSSLKIYTNHTLYESSEEREKQANSFSSAINFKIPVGECRNMALSMMCHTVYPYCAVVPGIPTPRKMCKSSCEEFLTGQCKGYVSNDSLLHELLVNGCDERDITGGDSPECIPISLQFYRNNQIETIEDTGDCFRNNGRGYSGDTYRTHSGALCQSWTTQSPHSHPMLPELYKADLEQAHFSCRNPGGIGTRPWCYTNDPHLRWEYCDIPKCDTCEQYRGEICKNLEGYSNTSVTIRRSKQLQSQEDIEEKLVLFSRSVLFLQSTEGCMNILNTLLCHGAFPQCTPQSTKQLCSVHCEFKQALEDHCPKVYNALSEFGQSNNHLMSIPNCDITDSEQCMSINYMTATASQHNWNNTVMKDSCYEGNGQTYNGTVHTTENGIPCQAWNTQHPHSHPMTPARYPELKNSENYCRNPGKLKERPWCYTTNSKTVWQYCNVQNCDAIIKEVPKGVINEQIEDVSQPQSKNSGKSSAPIIGVMSVMVVILLTLMGVAFTGCYCFMTHKSRRAKAMLETEFRLSKMTREAFEGEKYVTNADYTKVPSAKRSQSLVIPENFRLIDSKSIKYVSQLGQGNFGIVFKGKAFGIKGEDEEDEGIDVAVKTLKEEASSEVKQDFIDEAKLMFTFDHPNILTIHGVCMTEMPYQLVFEYMDEGDLTKFLRSRASSQQRRLVNPFSYRSRTESSYSDDPASLTKAELLYICKQIAAGMNYLAENKHVHRDLACRNCLIKSDLVVKIGDFGMSRNLYSKDYYRINGSAVLPVRWMSPESLIYGKFSIEADVWSFGIVMWEVFSFALQPYYGISNEEVTEAIRRGKTLNRPDDCPIEVYRLMKECWTMDPTDRISFAELQESLSSLHQMASLCGSVGEKFTDDEDAFSDSSDMPSDTFYSEEHLDEISEQNL